MSADVVISAVVVVSAGVEVSVVDLVVLPLELALLNPAQMILLQNSHLKYKPQTVR